MTVVGLSTVATIYVHITFAKPALFFVCNINLKMTVAILTFVVFVNVIIVVGSMFVMQ